MGLLSLLIGGNFAEIKSTVFKKYNKQSLFKITTSDICERFKLVLFMMIILLLNVAQGGVTRNMLMNTLLMVGLVLVAEILADWIKHSFITKFMFIKSEVYNDYALILAGDVTGIGHDQVKLDHTHAVVKRLGLAMIPLFCVMCQYLTEAHRYGKVSVSKELIGSWLALLLVKVFMGLSIKVVASGILERNEGKDFSSRGGRG